jgi:hypothetical protein
MKNEKIVVQILLITIIKALKMKQIYKPEENVIQNYNISDSKYYFAYGECTSSNCDSCISSIVCKCPLGYAQKKNVEVNINQKSCQYKLKKQWIFFLLELFFPFGIGHFYAKRILYGIIKLLFLIIIISCDIFVKRLIKGFKEIQNFNIGMYLVYSSYIFWQLVDIVLIGINQFTDGNGMDFATLNYDD